MSDNRYSLRVEYDPDPDLSYLDQEEFSDVIPDDIVSYGAVLLADGETLDPSTEDRLVLSGTAGKVAVFDGGAGDTQTDVLFMAGDTEQVSTSGSAEPAPVEVV